MKAIKIQKDSNVIDHLSVFINNEKYILSNQSLAVQVAGDKMLEVKVRFEGHISEVKRFDPKDNMILHISKNRTLLKRYWILIFTFAALAGFTGSFLAKTSMYIIIGIPIILALVVLSIFEARTRKMIYTINDISSVEL